VAAPPPTPTQALNPPSRRQARPPSALADVLHSGEETRYIRTRPQPGPDPLGLAFCPATPTPAMSRDPRPCCATSISPVEAAMRRLGDTFNNEFRPRQKNGS